MFFCLSLVWLRSSVGELDFCITPRRSIPPQEKRIHRGCWYMGKLLVKLAQSQTSSQPRIPFRSSHSVSHLTWEMRSLLSLCCSSKCPRTKQGKKAKNEGLVITSSDGQQEVEQMLLAVDELKRKGKVIAVFLALLSIIRPAQIMVMGAPRSGTSAGVNAELHMAEF